jgi:hypothetical protein
VGSRHKASKPPPINTATPPPKAAETEAAAPFESAADPQQAAIDEKVKREVAIQEAERKKYCQSMRTNLAQLENNPRVRVEVDGEVRRLSEEQRQQRISEAKQAIVKNCT